MLKLTAAVTEAKAEAEVLKMQNAYLLSFLKFGFFLLLLVDAQEIFCQARLCFAVLHKSTA